MKRLINSLHSKNMSLTLFSSMFLFLFFAFSNSIIKSPTVSVAADKMNIFYIGIDNPITVAVEGTSSDKLKVTCEDATVENLGHGHFIVKPTKPGKKKVIVSAEGVTTQEVIYRVKRIPDPTSMVKFSSGGAMWVDEFKAQKKIRATLIGWPIEEKCVVQDFAITRQNKMKDPVEVINRGEEFNELTLKLIEDIQPGDVVYFDNIRCKCPGDPAPRKINSMVFKMK